MNGQATPATVGRYYQWKSGHDGRGKLPKVVHRTRLGAWWHIVQVRWRKGVDQEPLNAYRCTWTDDYREGQTGQPRWHVGRPFRRTYP